MIFRPATIADIPAINKISERVWDGHDYLPFFIERWIAEGGVFVGEVSGKVIGVGRITRFGEREWWLEGLRVAIEEQGKGYGKEMQNATIAEVERIGEGVMRYATGNTNRSARMGEHTSFEVVLRVCNLMYDLENTAISDNINSLLTEHNVYHANIDEPGLADYLLEGCKEHYRGFLCLGWEFPEASVDRIINAAKQGYLLVAESSGKPEAVVLLLVNDQRPSETLISIIHGNEKVLATRILPCLPAVAKAYNPLSKGIGKGHPEEYSQILMDFGFKASGRSTYLQVFERQINRENRS